MRGASAFLLAMAVSGACAPQPAAALGDLPFPGGRARAWPASGAMVEAADAELYGIEGLRAAGLRLTLPLWRLVTVIEVVHAGSAPATESRATVRVAAGVVAVEGSVERAVVGDVDARLSSVGVAARLPLGSAIDVVFRATGIGVGGRPLAGFDADALLWLRPVPAVGLEAGISIHRRYGQRLYARAALEISPALGVRAGFDGATETAGASVRVAVRAMAVEVGADVHAVLGVTRRVALRWRW